MRFVFRALFFLIVHLFCVFFIVAALCEAAAWKLDGLLEVLLDKGWEE